MAVLVAPGALIGASAAPAGVALALVAGLLALAGFASEARSETASRRNFRAALRSHGVVMGVVVPMRFFAPLLLLLLLYIYWGLDAVCRWLGAQARTRRVALVAVAVAFAAQGGWATWRAARAAYDTALYPYRASPRTTGAHQPHVLMAAREYAGGCRPDGNLDPAMYLYTGRKSVRGFVQDPFLLHYSGAPVRSRWERPRS